MPLKLDPHEQQVLAPWYFWLSLVCSSSKSQKYLSQLCVESLLSAQESGLNWGPPYIVLPLILSLSPDLDAQDQIHVLLNNERLSTELRESLRQVIYSSETVPPFNTLWSLAKRKLLLIDQSLISQLIGFCLATLINSRLDMMTISQRKALQKNSLDLTSLRLLLDETDYPASDQSSLFDRSNSIFNSQFPSVIPEERLNDLSLLTQYLSHGQTQTSSNHDHHQLKPELFGLVQYFEALYQPSRRLLYTRLARANESMGKSSISSFKEMQLKQKSRAEYISQQVNQSGAVKALGRSGRLEHLAYSEWANLDEELVPDLDYFYLKWAENELIYLERDHQQQQKSKWSLTHHFTDPLRMSSSSQIDEKFGLGLLSWLHLVSLQVSQALKVHLGKQSLTIDWIWKEMAESQNLIKKQQAAHEFFAAECDVFSLLNPLISHPKSSSHGQRFIHHKSQNISNKNHSGLSPRHQLRVSYSSQMLSQLSAHELHLYLGQDFQWQINLKPEYSSRLKLNTHWLNSSNIISIQNKPPKTQVLNAFKSFSHLSQSLFYILSLMIQDIDKQS